MKRLLPLALLCLLWACNNSTSGYQLQQQISELETRVSTLERQLTEKENELQSRVYTTPSPNTDTKAKKHKPAVAPVTTNKSTDSYGTESRSSYSARCQAFTRAGNQCKRTSRKGSYCWQHGG